jgi:hypothetical protein
VTSPDLNGSARVLAADDAEAAVVGRMLYGPAEVDRVRALVRLEDLRVWPCRVVFQAAAELRDALKPVSLATVFQHLRSEGNDKELGANPALYLAELYDADPTGADLAYMAERVREAADRRHVLNLARVLQRDVGDGVEPVAETLNRFKEQIDQVARARTETGSPWPALKVASEVGRDAPALDFLWEGVVARGHFTLVSALMKCGKTTMFGHLLRALELGDDFLGLWTRPANVLVVSEESETIWAERIKAVGIADHVAFLTQPFLGKPSPAEWVAFLGHLLDQRATWPYDLLLLDTLSNLWPVVNENDAAEVVSALMPLRRLTAAGLAVVAVHHFGKTDPGEGKGARGSTGIGGFADALFELKRLNPDKPADRARVLSGWGRWQVPDELVIRLAEDGRTYAVEGNRRQVRQRGIRAELRNLLPSDGPGWTYEEIRANWPGEEAPRKEAVLAALKEGLKTDFRRTGAGVKGDPYKFLSVSVPGLLGN